MTTSTEIAVRAAGPLDLEGLSRVGKWLASAEVGDGGFANEAQFRTKANAAALRLFYIQQLGLPPIAVLQLGVTPDGRIIIGAQLLRALAERDGYRVRFTDETGTSCTAVLVRIDTGEVIGDPVTFTLDDAKRAGLANKRNWQTYPGRMLRARASTYAIRDNAPGVALGLVTGEEIGEAEWIPATDEAPSVATDAAPSSSEDIPWPDSKDEYEGQQELASDATSAEGGDAPDETT